MFKFFGKTEEEIKELKSKAKQAMKNAWEKMAPLPGKKGGKKGGKKRRGRKGKGKKNGSDEE